MELNVLSGQGAGRIFLDVDPLQFNKQNGNLHYIGGAGSGIPVVDTPPIGPVFGDQWFLHTPYVPTTIINGSGLIQDGGATGSLFITVHDTNLIDLSIFGHPNGFNGMFTTNPGVLPGPPGVTTFNSVLDPQFGYLVILTSGGTTWNDIVTAIFNYLTVNMPHATLIQVGLTVPADGAIVSWNVISFDMLNNGQLEAFNLYIQGTSGQFYTGLNP